MLKKLVLEILPHGSIRLQGKRVVETGFQDKITAKNKALDDFTVVEKTVFTNTKGELVERWGAFVYDASDFLFSVADKRDELVEDLIAVVGIDKGTKEWLKVVLLLIPKGPDGRDRNGPRGQKYSGVNKVFNLAAVPDIPENNNNIRIILNRINFWGIACWVAVDHKMKNILCGIQSHSCTFPCVVCLADKDSLDTIGELRTVASLGISFEEYVAAGSVKKDAPKFHSVTEQPLLFETLEEVKSSLLLVLDVLPPSELHHCLRFVNHIYKFMKNFHDGTQSWENIVKEWAKVSLSKRELYHGGEFEGNQCRSLLEHLSFFEDASGNPKILLMAPFLVTLKEFNKIWKKC